MSNQPTASDDEQGNHEDAFIEALLESATSPQDYSAFITQAMRRLETEQPVSTTKSTPSLLRWFGIAIAASLLLGLFLFVPGNSNAAIAAVRRSLDSVADPVVRKYKLAVNYQADGEEIPFESDLYVQGNDRFALSHSGLLPGSSFWLGKSGEQAFVVPAVGTVRKGDDLLLSRWLSKHQQLETPYLHVATLLERMSEGYVLEELEDESFQFADANAEPCQHILATRRRVLSSKLPQVIELWCSQETGAAMRVIAQWDDRAVGIRSLALTLEDEYPELGPEWFTAEGHMDRSRRVQEINVEPANQSL